MGNMVSIVFITHLCGYTLKFVNLTHDFEIENVSESHDFSVI